MSFLNFLSQMRRLFAADGHAPHKRDPYKRQSCSVDRGRQRHGKLYDGPGVHGDARMLISKRKFVYRAVDGKSYVAKIGKPFAVRPAGYPGAVRPVIASANY